MSATSGKGRVVLVGAGPGDPGLLTLAGRDALAVADVVLYDALASERLLAHASPSAEKVLVGKRHGLDSVPQHEIEELMLARARAGLVVVRLKGGDPFIFGRGGEEAEACRRAGIPFSVVPGVTSAIAAPAAAGIPLTHREHSSLVTIVTGQPGGARPGYDVDWAALARTGGTLVFLMAMTRIGEIAEKLIEAGLAADTPAAGIRWGTLPRQRTVVTTLGDLARAAAAELVRPPVVFVVGQVAALAGELSWFESRPLFGRRVLVTRARHQADALASRLEALGAEVVEFPTIELARLPVDAARLDALAGRDLLVLTSANGADALFDGLREAGRDLRLLAGVRIAAIGPATRAAVEARGLVPDVVASASHAEGLLEALGDVAGLDVVVARAETAREVLVDGLCARGAKVEVLPLYRTSSLAPDEAATAALGRIDAATFTSASTVAGFDARTGGAARRLLAGCRVAAIGPVTARALEAIGVRADVVPAEATVDALARALADDFANRPGLS